MATRKKGKAETMEPFAAAVYAASNLQVKVARRVLQAKSQEEVTAAYDAWAPTYHQVRGRHQVRGASQGEGGITR